MQINLIQISKTKQAFALEAEKEYLKRLQPFTKINIITIKQETAGTKEQIVEKEGEAILAKIPSASYVIVLDELGQELSSQKFAAAIENWQNQGKSIFTFIIGGPFGTSQKVKTQANLILAFSKFTFTHQMIRMIFWEQIYRAFTILKNKNYHY